MAGDLCSLLPGCVGMLCKASFRPVVFFCAHVCDLTGKEREYCLVIAFYINKNEKYLYTFYTAFLLHCRLEFIAYLIIFNHALTFTKCNNIPNILCFANVLLMGLKFYLSGECLSW